MPPNPLVMDYSYTRPISWAPYNTHLPDGPWTNKAGPQKRGTLNAGCALTKTLDGRKSKLLREIGGIGLYGYAPP